MSNIKIKTHSYRRVPITMEERKQDIINFLDDNIDEITKLTHLYEKRVAKIKQSNADLQEELDLIIKTLNGQEYE